ncbi:MAG: RagB/SusD family nutrient uptake outer membrane protein [Prevotella sp.]|nr:RagB/SusD family nutrient uptake outer membrane protein [Prevotella sp.]
MKTFSKIFIASLCGVMFVSCNDLNTEPYGSTITSAQKEEVAAANPDIIEASVNGVMTMFSVYLNGISTSSSTYHNDYGYPSVMLMTDSRGRDLVSQNTGYNWYSNQVRYTDQASTYIMPTYVWNTMYNQIYTANGVLSTISPDNEDPTDETLMYYYAQALAVRAFDYFILAQIYQYNYVGHESSACVPLVLDTNSDELANEGGGDRATVQEVYDQILSDLDRAVNLLESTSVTRPSGREGKAFVSAAVAHGLRARVYLTMHNYSAAVTDAQYAIDNSGATPYSMAEVSVPTFVTSADNSWMWAVNIEETDDVVESGIINFPSHMGSLNYGYASVGAWRAGSEIMIDHIPDTDVRKGWWLDDDGNSPNLNAEQAAYIASAGVDLHTQVKFGPYNDEIYTSNNANDIPLMRIEEMYLILAEAQAMSGNPAAGAQTLQNFVSTYRDPAYTCTATTAENVQKAVLFQRRVELWGEGFSWFDLMRLNKGVDRRGAGFAAAYVFNISASDPIMILQIPNAEIQANSNISQQNPAGTEPNAVEDVITDEVLDEYNW